MNEGYECHCILEVKLTLFFVLRSKMQSLMHLNWSLYFLDTNQVLRIERFRFNVYDTVYRLCKYLLKIRKNCLSYCRIRKFWISRFMTFACATKVPVHVYWRLFIIIRVIKDLRLTHDIFILMSNYFCWCRHIITCSIDRKLETKVVTRLI